MAFNTDKSGQFFPTTPISTFFRFFWLSPRYFVIFPRGAGHTPTFFTEGSGNPKIGIAHKSALRFLSPGQNCQEM